MIIIKGIKKERILNLSLIFKKLSLFFAYGFKFCHNLLRGGFCVK